MSNEEFDKLPFEELVFRAEMIEEEYAEQQKNDLKTAAFTAWLVTNSVNPTGKSYKQYLSLYGLGEKEPPLSAELKAELTKKGIRKAESVLERLKQSGVK